MTVTALIATLFTALAADAPNPPERLYGRVATVEGQSFEGFLRWDRNEATTLDYLDGRKVVPIDYLREAAALDPEVAARLQEERTIVAFGMRITWDEDDTADPFATAAAIRMGHIRTIERVGRGRVRLTLKDGAVVDLLSGSSDIGPAMRGLEIDRPGGRRVTLDWHQIERVDLFDAARPGAEPVSQRLHGTVFTWDGSDFSGAVTWDLDESVATDVLDGRADGVDYEIPFGEIEEIAWESERSALVTLTSGEQLELRGTNDVNRQNRGIEVAGAFGRAIVGWGDFRSVRFGVSETQEAAGFDPGRRLRGTVRAVDGRAIEGLVRWDNDEEFAWELLDGWSGDTDLDIEFGAIASIEKLGDDRVVVTTWSGDRVELEDRSDVNGDNNGIFVLPEGRARRLVRWVDFDRVDFHR